jgi:hypothetical protein
MKQGGRVTCCRTRNSQFSIHNQQGDKQMTSKLQRMSKFSVPILLLGMMAGCATTKDLEKVQMQVDALRATANQASSASQEAKAIASDARNTANAASALSISAKNTSSEASELATAAVKNSEAAATAAMQAQKTVDEAKIAVPMMRLDPMTGRYVVNWVVWPAPEQPAAALPAPVPAPNGTQP